MLFNIYFPVLNNGFEPIVCKLLIPGIKGLELNYPVL